MTVERTLVAQNKIRTRGQLVRVWERRVVVSSDGETALCGDTSFPTSQGKADKVVDVGCFSVCVCVRLY